MVEKVYVTYNEVGCFWKGVFPLRAWEHDGVRASFC